VVLAALSAFEQLLIAVDVAIVAALVGLLFVLLR
jgi:hypothetical protein